jgi:hypothetical protein
MPWNSAFQGGVARCPLSRLSLASGAIDGRASPPDGVIAQPVMREWKPGGLERTPGERIARGPDPPVDSASMPRSGHHSCFVDRFPIRIVRFARKNKSWFLQAVDGGALSKTRLTIKQSGSAKRIWGHRCWQKTEKLQKSSELAVDKVLRRGPVRLRPGSRSRQSGPPRIAREGRPPPPWPAPHVPSARPAEATREVGRRGG